MFSNTNCHSHMFKHQLPLHPGGRPVFKFLDLGDASSSFKVLYLYYFGVDDLFEAWVIGSDLGLGTGYMYAESKALYPLAIESGVNATCLIANTTCRWNAFGLDGAWCV